MKRVKKNAAGGRQPFSSEHLERFRQDPAAAAFARELGIAL